MRVARIHMFSDESGDFTFKPHGSKYFLIATVTMGDCAIGNELRALQRELAWSGIVIEAFHAKDDFPATRRLVYDLISNSDVRIDATCLEKRKTEPKIAADSGYFYKLATFLHFKWVIPHVANRSDDLMVVASALTMKKKKVALHASVKDVVDQVSPTRRFVTAFIQNSTDPCLQIADYAAWAVQRKLEMGDSTWLEMIMPNVVSIFEPYKRGPRDYY
jgi:hypothetical protein